MSLLRVCVCLDVRVRLELGSELDFLFIFFFTFKEIIMQTNTRMKDDRTDV